MLIYGWSNVGVKTEQSKTAVCPSCDTKGSLLFGVLSTHVHLFWIPIFPVRKKGVIECLNCRMGYENALDAPVKLQQEYNVIKAQALTPWWQFIGIFIIVGLVGWFIHSSNERDKKEQAWIMTPHVGDSYEYKTNDGNYSVYRVAAIQEDSLILQLNKYMYNSMTGVSSADEDEHYDSLFFIVPTKTIQHLFKVDTIYQVNRK